MRHQIGDRVGAISHADAESKTAYIYGYGTFRGDVIPDPSLGVTFFGGPMEHENPCIALDSGKLVFGCECWWGSEESVRKQLASYETIIEVDIEQARAEAALARKDAEGDEGTQNEAQQSPTH